jgi:TrmH family RNA methyltransferase
MTARVHAREITSTHHPLLKQIRAAWRRGGLTPQGCCAVEGPHLVEEALRSGLEVVALLAGRSAAAHLRQFQDAGNGRSPAYLMPDRVFRSLSQTEAPQGIAALVRLKKHRLEECLSRANGLVAVAVGLQDPGNLGTLLRALEAFGGTACLLGPGTVSPYNPKAVRASAGALFRLPVFPRLPLDRILEQCRAHGLLTVGLRPRAPDALTEINLKKPVALFIGSEAAGLPASLEAKLDHLARIPLAAPVESLNAAVAASLAFYETARQRGWKE